MIPLQTLEIEKIHLKILILGINNGTILKTVEILTWSDEIWQWQTQLLNIVAVGVLVWA